MQVVAALKQTGTEVVVFTDGTALNKPEVTGRLLDLGVDAVSVSLDSADAAYNDRWRPALNRRDGWNIVTAGIRALLAARGGRPRPLVGIYTVITRLNLREITAVPRLAASPGRRTGQYCGQLDLAEPPRPDGWQAAAGGDLAGSSCWSRRIRGRQPGRGLRGGPVLCSGSVTATGGRARA